MKTTKKFVSVLLALLMLLSVFALAASATGSTTGNETPQTNQDPTNPAEPTGYDPASGESEISYVLGQLKLFFQNIRNNIEGFMKKLLPDFLADLLFPPEAEEGTQKV